MKELLTRSLSGIVFVALVLACTYYSFWSFAILVSICAIVGLAEFYALIRKSGFRPLNFFGIIVALIFLIHFSFTVAGEFDYSSLLSYVLIVPLTLVFELFRKKPNIALNAGVTLGGLLYVVMPLSLALIVGTLFGVYNYEIMFGYFILLWTNDTGAYLVGSLIGRNKLMPSISPGKTWEGFFGGVLLAFAVSYFMAGWLDVLDSGQWLTLGLIIPITATLGDLVESSLKRIAHIKDSGSIMPGHGGVLDRFDGLLGSLPFVLIYLYISMN